jgi:hypothetical protein
MLANVATATLQMLFFRAGPQDFPYAERLIVAIPLLSVAGNALLLGAVLPPALAAVLAVMMVLVMAAFTRGLLRTRGLLPRFQQTFNSLLTTDLALKLVMIPAFYKLAPKLQELAANPELLSDPEKFVLPQGPVLIANLVSYWSFAVSANIYRHAANVHILFGILLTFIALTLLLFATAVTSGVLRVFMG